MEFWRSQKEHIPVYPVALHFLAFRNMIDIKHRWGALKMFFRILFHVSPQFFHECSKEVHVDISTDLIQNKPISDKTFRSNIGNRSSSYNIICVAKFACKKKDYLIIKSLIKLLKQKMYIWL
jgi:hypothetical protein